MFAGAKGAHMKIFISIIVASLTVTGVAFAQNELDSGSPSNLCVPGSQRAVQSGGSLLLQPQAYCLGQYAGRAVRKSQGRLIWTVAVAPNGYIDCICRRR